MVLRLVSSYLAVLLLAYLIEIGGLGDSKTPRFSEGDTEPPGERSERDET